MALFGRKQKVQPQVDMEALPRHVAIIMDGNGRWAKRRGMPRKAGHAVGAETFRTIATFAKELGLEFLTVYAFSTENWKRPEDEVDAIMGLLEKYLREAIETMAKDKVKMAFFGDLAPLSPELRALCAETEEISKGYDGCQVNVCFNYGGRAELLHLPEIGIRGNTHFLMSDLNNREIAELVDAWLKKRVPGAVKA